MPLGLDLVHEAQVVGVPLLARRGDVAEHLPPVALDMLEAVEAAAGDYVRLVGEIEAKRRELVDLRRTQVWAAIFPHESLTNEPNTQSLVGAKKALQRPHLPTIEVGLPADSVFALLRDDVTFCASVATVEQAAAEQGVTAAKLTGREASWQDGQADIIGPSFGAAWGGSPEEKEQANKIQQYAEATRKRLRGDS